MQQQSNSALLTNAVGWLPIATAATTVVLWAAAFPAIRIGLTDFTPLSLAAVRFACASVFALTWLVWVRPPMPTVPDLFRFMACGGIGISLYNFLLHTGQTTVSAGAASFIINLQAVLTAFLAMVFLREPFNRWAWLGTSVSVIGVATLASGQPGGLSFGEGVTLVLAAAACSGASFVLQRPLVARYGALSSAAINILMGNLFLLPWLPTGLTQANAASHPALSAAIFLGIFPGAIGYLTWMSTLGAFGAARAANILYLVPPVATTIAYFAADEVPTLLTLGGGMIALLGVIIVNTRGRS